MNVQTTISTTAAAFAIPASRWNESIDSTLSTAELLLYRSNLLGSDLTVTNFGGGNTSARFMEIDALNSEAVEVLWVKGSGGDIGSMKLDGFTTLYQGKLLALEQHYAEPDDDDKMVGYLPHCTFNLSGRAASIDTPLHSMLPFAHVDHVHPDAIIALVAAPGGEAATHEIWDGDRRKERAATHGIDPGTELEEHYRQRSMLKRDGLAEDIAEAAYWLACDLSSKSTGNMINVDAGNAQAFTR